jgi:mitochondrial import receptor subunit TOM40
MFVAANNNLLSSYTVKYTIPALTGEEDSPFRATSTSPSEPPPTGGSTTGAELKGSSTICANWNMGQSLLTLNYLRVVTPQRVTLAAELQCNPLSLDSQVMLGAEFKLSRN